MFLSQWQEQLTFPQLIPSSTSLRSSPGWFGVILIWSIPLLLESTVPLLNWSSSFRDGRSLRLLNFHLGNRFAPKLEYRGNKVIVSGNFPESSIPHGLLHRTLTSGTGGLLSGWSGSFRNMTSCLSLLRFFFLVWLLRNTPCAYLILSLSFKESEILADSCKNNVWKGFCIVFYKENLLLLIYGLYLLSFDHKNSLFSLMKNNMLYLERADKPRALWKRLL